jgi:hypothetical protein
MPSITIDSKFSTWPHIIVNLRNIGGSPIGVARIALVVSYAGRGKSSLRGPQAQKWAILIPDHKGDMLGTSGPSLPFTISGYHSQRWEFGKELAEMFKKSASNNAGIKNVLIHVELATGKVVKKRLPIWELVHRGG